MISKRLIYTAGLELGRWDWSELKSIDTWCSLPSEGVDMDALLAYALRSTLGDRPIEGIDGRKRMKVLESGGTLRRGKCLCWIERECEGMIEAREDDFGGWLLWQVVRECGLD